MSGSASAVAASPMQNAGGIGIYQYSKAIAKSVGIVVDHNRPFAYNTASQHAAQAQQGAAAAYLAAFASTIADDLAVGAKNSFQERNGAQNRLPSVTVVHKKLCH